LKKELNEKIKGINESVNETRTKTEIMVQSIVDIRVNDIIECGKAGNPI
jgi:hypothetical protein